MFFRVFYRETLSSTYPKLLKFKSRPCFGWTKYSPYPMIVKQSILGYRRYFAPYIISFCPTIGRDVRRIKVNRPNFDIYAWFGSRGREDIAASTFGTDASTRGWLRLLSEDQAKILEDQRVVTRRTNSVAAQLRLGDHRVETADAGEVAFARYIDFPFSVVVAGEFNAGKSTVINALLGEKLLETGPLPTTDVVTIIAGGSESDKESKTKKARTGGVIVQEVVANNVEILRDLVLVDTPGTNAIDAGHEYRTKRWLPNADLIFFVVSAEKPFAESERAFLQSVQKYRKQIVLLINKVDTLESLGPNYGEAEKASVVDYVASNASSLLGMHPTIFPISARYALDAKAFKPTCNMPAYGPGSALWQRSGFEQLQKFLVNELTNESKVKSKLSNPLGVAEATANEALAAISERQKEIEADLTTLSLLEEQMKSWMSDLLRDVGQERSVVRGLLRKQGERCKSMVQGLNIWKRKALVFDGAQFEKEWEQSMATTDKLEADINTVIGDIAELVAKRAQAQSEAVLEYLGERPMNAGGKMIGHVTRTVVGFTRSGLETRLQHVVREVLKNHDHEAEAVYNSLQRSNLFAVAIHAGAATAAFVGFFSPADNLLAALAATSLVVLGFMIIPLRDHATYEEYQSRVGKISDSLDESLVEGCEREVERVHREIVDGIAPYTRFVETESSKLRTLRSECEEVLAECHRLRGRIKKL